MRKTVITLVATAATFVALPAVAHASTASFDPGGGDEASSVSYQAAPGEANRLSISVSGSTATIDDTGATITAGANCAPVNPNRVTCTAPGGGGIDFLDVVLGDGDDTSMVSGAPSHQQGGAGRDMLTGGERTDNLEGQGGGQETLLGMAGDDTISDGDTTGSVDADMLAGGNGTDSLRYDGRTGNVFIDLRFTGAGEAGENDTATSFENANGGAGNDTITGADGPSFLSGLAGNDTVDGEGGDDTVLGGTGNDVVGGEAGRDELQGEAGNDLLRLDNPPGEFDRVVACGDGQDRVFGVGPAPSLPVTCELGEFESDFLTRIVPIRLSTSSVTLKLPCPPDFRRSGNCAGRLTIEPKGAYLRSASTRKAQRYGTESFHFGRKGGRVTVALDADGRRQLRKSSFKLQYDVKMKDVNGQIHHFVWTSLIVRSSL